MLKIGCSTNEKGKERPFYNKVLLIEIEKLSFFNNFMILEVILF